MSVKLKDPTLLRELCFIDGGWSARGQRRRLGRDNPATIEKLGSIPNMGAAETRRAIAARCGGAAAHGERVRPKSAPSSCAAGST